MRHNHFGADVHGDFGLYRLILVQWATVVVKSRTHDHESFLVAVRLF